MLEENVKVAFPGLTLPEVTRHRNFPGKERRGMKGQRIPATGVGAALGDKKEGDSHENLHAGDIGGGGNQSRVGTQPAW